MVAPALVSLALTALLPTLNPGRVGELSESIAAVAETPDDVARLAVTVARESSGLRAYETCERTGDSGRAISSYHIWRFHWGGHSRAEICADPILAARLALVVLKRRTDIAWSFTRYIGADTPAHAEVRLRVKLYGKALAAMGEQTS